jgi:hypothetical protein
VLISWKLSLDKHAVVTLLAGLIEQRNPHFGTEELFKSVHQFKMVMVMR